MNIEDLERREDMRTEIVRLRTLLDATATALLAYKEFAEKLWPTSEEAIAFTRIPDTSRQERLRNAVREMLSKPYVTPLMLATAFSIPIEAAKGGNER